MEHRFGAAPPGTLGVEEEVFLVDAQTFDVVPAFSRAVGEVDGFKPELFECLAELTTPVVAGAQAVVAELRRLRGALLELVEPHGLLLHAAGMHALAHAEGQPIVAIKRYRRMAAQSLGTGIHRQLVCGLHVHVSVPDPAACLTAFEAIVPWLPTLLALSANSPYAESEDTGRRSERAHRLLEMPTGGTPPVLRDWDDWITATAGDDSRRHWDAWPRPEHGTLEVRVMDMQTDVRRSAGMAAIVQALVAGAESQAAAYDRELYAERRTRAATAPPDPDDVAALAAAVRPRLDPVGAELADLVLGERPEAERQLEISAEQGIAAVPQDVVERTVAFD